MLLCVVVCKRGEEVSLQLSCVRRYSGGGGSQFGRRDGQSVTLVSVADPDPGSGAFLTPGSGIRDPGWVESQHPDPGSGMNNPDHIFQSLETIFLFFLGLKYLNSLMRIRDLGSRIRDGDSSYPGSRIRDGKKSDPGSGINIPDPQH